MTIRDWSTKRFLWTHSFIEPARNCLPIYSSKFLPLLQCFCFSEGSNFPIIPTIILLFFLGSPPTITWLVVSCAIYSIYCVLYRWPFSHISKKILIIAPSVADFNTFCAVFMECGRGWIGASASHIPPYFVCWSFRKSVSSIAINTYLPSNLIIEASTRFAVPRFELSSDNYPIGAA